MSRIHQLIESLRQRSDVGVVEQEQSWLVVITKGRDMFCEVTIPRDVLEWFVSVKQRHDKREVWSDWMDYTGYDDSPKEKLEAEMADDILAFIDRVSASELVLPCVFMKRGPNKGAAANVRPAGQSDGSDNLAAIVAADRAFPAAVAELGR